MAPAPRRLTPAVEIIVPAVPRAPRKAPTGVGPVPEKRRFRGRRAKSQSRRKLSPQKNIIVDARSHTGSLVALRWLVPYNSMLWFQQWLLMLIYSL